MAEVVGQNAARGRRHLGSSELMRRAPQVSQEVASSKRDL